MVFTGLFLLLFTVTVSVLMFRLIYLPVTMVSKVQKAKYEVAATLACSPNSLPAVSFGWPLYLVAMIDIPDFISPLQRIEEARLP